jgi:hypothetical protein
MCLNELGGAKTMNKKIIPFLLPKNKYRKIGFLNKEDIQLKINNKRDLEKFQEDVKEYIEPVKVNISNYNSQVKEFIEFLKR